MFYLFQLKDKKDRLAAIQSVMAEMKVVRMSPTLETLHLVLDYMVDWKAFDEANSTGKVDPNMEKSIVSPDRVFLFFNQLCLHYGMLNNKFQKLCVSWLNESLSLLESQSAIQLTSVYDHAFFNTAMYIARGLDLNVARSCNVFDFRFFFKEC